MTKKQNQDNFFCVTDNELKIFGVFDGHGEYGHLVSSYAQGIMLDFIRNREIALRPRYLFDSGKLLIETVMTDLENAYDLDIRRALRRCFKYT